MKLHLCDWDKYGPTFQSYGGSHHQARRCISCGKIQVRCVIHIFRAQITDDRINKSIAAQVADKPQEQQP